MLLEKLLHVIFVVSHFFLLIPHLKASVGNEAELLSLAGALDPNPMAGKKMILSQELELQRNTHFKSMFGVPLPTLGALEHAQTKCTFLEFV